MWLHCNGSRFGQHEENDIKRFIVYDLQFHMVSVEKCDPVPSSIANVLEANNIEPSTVLRAIVDIELSSTEHDLKKENFEGLTELEMLALEYLNEETVHGEPKLGFLEPFKKLIWLKVSNAVLPPMPMEATMDTVILERGESSGKFGGCDNLISLILIQWEIREDSWLRSCPEIDSLSMDSMSSQSVIRAIRGATTLTTIIAAKCNIFTLPKDIFDGMTDLETLDLRDNHLNTIFLNGELPSLETLTLSRNNMVYQIPELLYKLPNLKSLNLDENTSLNLCRIFKEYNKSADCVDKENFPGINDLTINYYDENILTLHSLLKWQEPLKVKLYHNKIEKVNFTKDDYTTLRDSKTDITLFGTIRIQCDCEHGYLARAIRENLLKSPDEGIDTITCSDFNDTSLLGTLPNQTECSKSPCDGCICRRMWADGDELGNRTVADCRGASVARIPHVEGLQKLLAHNNRVQLRGADIPDTLTELDLTRNDISSVDDDVASKLFSVENRQVLLSGNPIVCNCKNKNFINTIQIHRKQVLDYENITCAGNEKILLRNVDVTKLCDVLNNIFLIVPLAVSGGLLALVSLAIVLNYLFGQEIRIFLYARGWCLFCVTEDEEDERVYDAFVSFCHEDDDFVCQELVPKLEELGYKLCIHHRDWPPGDLIPNQIIRSVEASRKTIIVLSKNFACSLWGSLEFRTAHARALKDGVARVILVILDDVIDSENLDRDIRSYIRTNTYVKWNDPWFWEKIQYAMRRRRPRRDINNIEMPTSGNPTLYVVTLQEHNA
ncbi:TIR domain-containing protein [Phthorimaea operculella]|nr:TIR domain-containing protein [Phthorimaea operculella]